MNRYRIYLAAALGILALLALTLLWVNKARYYPQVKVELPDSSKLVFIDAPWTSEQKCQDENIKLISGIGKNCSQCKFAGSCTGQLDSAWQKALAGEAIDSFVIHSGTLRIMVNAGNASKQTCIVMAEQITLDKKQAARCVFSQ